MVWVAGRPKISCGNGNNRRSCRRRGSPPAAGTNCADPVFLDDPLRGDCPQVLEGQLVDFEPLGGRDGREVGAEARVFRGDGAAARDIRVLCLIAKPARDTLDRAVNFSTVPVDILAGYVRQVRLITVPLGVEDEGFLARLHPAAEFAGAQEKTELERHVETGQAGAGIRLGFRDVVNAVTAFGDDPAN